MFNLMPFCVYPCRIAKNEIKKYNTSNHNEGVIFNRAIALLTSGAFFLNLQLHALRLKSLACNCKDFPDWIKTVWTAVQRSFLINCIY